MNTNILIERHRRKRPPFNELRSILFENRVTYAELGEAIGRCSATVSKCMNRQNASFTADEMVKIAKLLEIPQDDWIRVFFTDLINEENPKL